MSGRFKNALCQAGPPDSMPGYMNGYWHRCHRRAGHSGPHRSKHFTWGLGVTVKGESVKRTDAEYRRRYGATS